MSIRLNRRMSSRRSIPTPLPARMLVKTYESDTGFSRDVQRMGRQGWNLTSFRPVQPCDSLGLIRASGPGMVPAPARFRIEARYVCHTVSGPAPAAGRVRTVTSVLKGVMLRAVAHQDIDRSCNDAARC